MSLEKLMLVTYHWLILKEDIINLHLNKMKTNKNTDLVTQTSFEEDDLSCSDS